MKLIKTGLILFFAFLIFYPAGYYILPGEQEVNGSRLEADIDKNSVFAYVVNLDRSKERYKKVQPLVEQLKIPYKRFSAVDGSALSNDEFNKVIDISAYKAFMGNLPKKGTVGCSLSHINIWKEFLNSKYAYALIIEDDVRFSPDELSKTVQDVIKHGQFWDICSFELLHRGLPLKIKQINSLHNLSVYLVSVTHTGCYLVSRKAAEKLLKQALPIKIPVDHYFTRGWELGLTFMGVEPRIVKQDENEQSIIENSERKKDDFSQFYLKKMMFKIQTPVAYFLYNLKKYIEIKFWRS